MEQFKVLPVDQKLSQHARTTLTDPIYGYPAPVTVVKAGEYGPCRACLNTFEAGDRRILFLYNPFSANQESDFAGPIFIHDHNCQPYQSGGFPDPLRNLPLVFRAYTHTNEFVAAEFPSEGAETAIEKLFSLPEVALIHVRNHQAKCFIARIERISN